MNFFKRIILNSSPQFIIDPHLFDISYWSIISFLWWWHVSLILVDLDWRLCIARNRQLFQSLQTGFIRESFPPVSPSRDSGRTIWWSLWVRGADAWVNRWAGVVPDSAGLHLEPRSLRTDWCWGLWWGVCSCTLLFPWGSLSPQGVSWTGIENCLFYPLKYIFSYFCALLSFCNLSPGIFSSSEDIFIHG